jgi:hypothetical protein
MKHLGLFLIVIIVVSAVVLPAAYLSSVNQSTKSKDDFFFGVTYGQDTVEGAKLLIDKVQNYTNVFVIDSMPISNNEAELNEVCNYAAAKNLSFFVYFFSLYGSNWQREWVVTANQTWGEKFLGVYLRDEPGGRQIDLREDFNNASSYSEASELYVQAVSTTWSMQFLKEKALPKVTSDYVLYWFDYLAGFDIIFVELGWNNSRIEQIALCRGAANVQGKSWGAIITLTYQQPPYMETAPETYRDMLTAYDAGAKYILMFNYAIGTQPNQQDVLTDPYFDAMQQFWNYANANPRDLSKNQAQVAFVLPQNYGWGMRNPNDLIWGIWRTDNISATIWQKMTFLAEKYGLKLDIIYEENSVNLSNYYSKLYYWNQTIT